MQVKVYVYCIVYIFVLYVLIVKQSFLIDLVFSFFFCNRLVVILLKGFDRDFIKKGVVVRNFICIENLINLFRLVMELLIFCYLNGVQ